MAEDELLKNAKLKRRGAKAAMIRLGKALSILIEGKRPIDEVKEQVKKLHQSFEDLEDQHKEFTQLIEDGDEFEKEEQWLEECQKIFLDLTQLSSDYRECTDESECPSVTYEVINVQENDVKKPISNKRFCVTYCDMTKLINVQTLSYNEVKTKIKGKFQITEPFSIAVKLPEFQQYIDIDGTDDVDIFNEAKHILVRKQSSSSINAANTSFSGCCESAVSSAPVLPVCNGNVPVQIKQEVVDLTPDDNVPSASTLSPGRIPTFHKKPAKVNLSPDGPFAFTSAPGGFLTVDKKTGHYSYKIRELLQAKGAYGIIEELDNGLLSFKSRKEMVKMLVWYLIEMDGPKPTTKSKLALAQSIIHDFPLMDNEDGDAYTTWYTPSIGRLDSCGFLENRIRNVRRRKVRRAYIPKPIHSAIKVNEQENIYLCGNTGNVDDETEPSVDPSSVTSIEHLDAASTSAAAIIKRPRLAPDQYKVREILQEKNADEIIEELDNGLLSLKSRKEMVNILVSYLIEIEGRNPKTKLKLALAKSITHDFPLMENEDCDGYAAWYTPATGRQDASGFLEHRIRNVQRRQLPALSTPSSEAELINTVNPDLEDELLDDMISWLKLNNSPIDQVQEMMMKTCTARASLVRSNKISFNDLLIEYPRLVDTDGMIEQDFSILFPDTKDCLYLKWPKYSQLILKYAEKQVDWRHMLYFRGNLNTDDNISNIIFHILPLLFQPGMTIRTNGIKKKMVRATHADASSSFVHVEREYVPSLVESHNHVLPFILAIGEYEEPNELYVVIQRQVIKCKSLLHAVDICFKLFHILDIDFPWECQNTWDFFQKYIYGLGCGKGRKTTVSSVSLLGNFVTKKQSL